MPRQLIQDFKSSLLLNGTSDYISKSSQNVFNTGSYWVAFWVKGAPKGDTTIYCEGSSLTATPLFAIGTGQLTANNMKLSLFVRNDATATQLNFVSSTTTVFDGKWHHIVWADNSGNAKLYIDGIQDSTNFNYTPTGTYTLDRTGLGARVRNTVGNFFAGKLVDLQTGTGSITITQVVNIMNGNSPTKNLWWKLQEGAGLIANDSAGSNPGTINSGTYSSDVPSTKRYLVGGNLITNGDFEYAPPFTAATGPTAQRWIDGTASGATSSEPGKLFGWAIPASGAGGSATAQYDNSVKRSGSYSMKLSNPTVGSTMTVSNVSVAGTLVAGEGIPASPSTSYTLSAYIKTNNVIANSAYIDLREHSIAGANITTTSSAKLTGTNDWTLLSVTVTTQPTTYFLSVILRNNVAGNVSDAWFDDVVLSLTVPTPRQSVQNFNSALAFTSGSHHLDIKNGRILSTLTNATISAWIKPTAAGGVNGYGIYIERATAGNNIWKMQLQALTYKLGFTHRNDGGSLDQPTGNTSLKDGQYHHVAITKAGTLITFYVDGRLDGTFNLVGNDTLTNTNTQTVIGYDPADAASYFTGLVSGVRGYNSSLTANQVAQLYATGSAGVTPIFEYSLGEGAGTAANDTSGGGLTGTITGASYVSDTPDNKRQLIGDNLLYNGDFEYAPLSNTPLSTPGSSGKFIDGTSTGSSSNSLFGWHSYSGGASQTGFDTTTSHSGTTSLKLSLVGTGQYAEVSCNRKGVTALERYTGTTNFIPVNPSTSYTVTYWMKTNYISGDSNDGAFIFIQQMSGSGTSTSSSAPTKIKTTTGWTQYSSTFTTLSTTQFINLQPRIYGHTGTANLIMDAWFDDITLTPTTNTTRTLVT